MRIATIVGTRPCLIRTARTITLLDEAIGKANHFFMHTGQNAQPALCEQFYDDLKLRHPNSAEMHPADGPLPAPGVHWTGWAIGAITDILKTRAPGTDRVLVLGDTNTAFAATYAAARLGIPTYHVEAGNRCHDSTSPEELNRRPIDHMATVNLCYTERARMNLIREGLPLQRTFVVGNPITDLLLNHDDTDVLARLKLSAENYYLVTCHRAENVDNGDRRGDLFAALVQLAASTPVVVSTHPRLADQMRGEVLASTPFPVIFAAPFNFSDFATLEKNAKCVLTDSGTVEEELAYWSTPAVIIRDTTERPECQEHGSGIIVSLDHGADAIVSAVRAAERKIGGMSTCPCYANEGNTAKVIVNILLSEVPPS